jgi:hypothetical protein
VTYSVRDEPDFEPTYDEDEVIEVRKGDLRAILDVASESMDFGSGFLDNEQVEALRKGAEILSFDPLAVTPTNFECQYTGTHEWKFEAEPFGIMVSTGQPVPPHWWCWKCHASTLGRDDPAAPPEGAQTQGGK